MTPPTPTEIKSAALERVTHQYYKDFYLCSRFQDCTHRYDEPCPCGMIHEYNQAICEQPCEEFPGAKCQRVELFWVKA